ncbi:hypothetical protein PZH32_00510 [Adlercreutzia equolifaciens]|uniref:hypothetical protein n=1 Tax=Adlercreutzia equolifaciens TaxID=446660 RepID=UPI0023AF261A|nr:hypothetical protein [Adlercreutzia equolifaciens]MDE8701442.1 hypothetical protein [Adlercreutzia equolifaciens]
MQEAWEDTIGTEGGARASSHDSNAHWHIEVASSSEAVSSFSQRAWTLVVAAVLLGLLVISLFGNVFSGTSSMPISENATPLAASIAGGEEAAASGAVIADDLTPMASTPGASQDDGAALVIAAVMALAGAGALAVGARMALKPARKDEAEEGHRIRI